MAENPLIHKDPCDRIIIAAAVLNLMKVLAADEVFRDIKMST